MGLIFSASTGAMSSGHTSRIIGPIVRWFIPDISEVALGKVVFAVRKTAHLTEYAILAALVWRALRIPMTKVQGPDNAKRPQPWRWSQAMLALGVAAVYAASDEIHQHFVPTREARFSDVMLDSAGAALGLFAIWFAGRWRHRW